MSEFEELPVSNAPTPARAPDAKPVAPTDKQPSQQNKTILPSGITESGETYKAKEFIKDPGTGKTYPLNSEIGKQLQESGLAQPFTVKYPLNNKLPAQSPDAENDGAFYQQGVAPVKSMQQSLINLARNISSRNIHDVQDRYSKGNEASRTLLTGANAFMNFLVTNYMNKSQVTGQQLVNTDVRQPTRMDTSKPNDNFKGVLSSIQRVGSPGQGEQKPDGIWGVRTNNALQQVYSLAHALMGVVGDMGLNLSGYTNADLTELYNAIPKDIAKTSLNDKVQKAGIIAKNLDKFRALYDSFRETILNNPTYRAHIAQEKPLVINKPKQQNASTLNDYEKSLYEKHKATEIDVTLNGRKITVMPYNLLSIDNFKKFLNSKKDSLSSQELEAVNKNDKQTINKFLIEIANGLEK